MITSVNDLIGKALDYAVAKAKGWIDYPDDSIECGSIWHTDPSRAPYGEFIDKRHWNPSTDWKQGGLIIAQEGISPRVHMVVNDTIESWVASREWPLSELRGYCGPTPLIAAMRCFVASKLGPEIHIPKGIQWSDPSDCCNAMLYSI